MDDKLVERLRSEGSRFMSNRGGPTATVMIEAADEIEKLRERCDGYMGQVEGGAKVIKMLRSEIERLTTIIAQTRFKA